MGAEPIKVEIAVHCDGPDCTESATSHNTAEPTPDGWIPLWGPSDRLGRFYFHTGACYDKWMADLQNERMLNLEPEAESE